MEDCDVCRKQAKSSECNECIRRADLVDNFEEMSIEEIKQIKIAKWLKTVEWEKVKFTIEDGFWEKFYLATQFVSQEADIIHAVHCTEDRLIATDGRMGVAISVGIPNELVGKSIIDLLERDIASVITKPWLDEVRKNDLQALFESSSYGNSLRGSKAQLPLKQWRFNKGNGFLVEIADTVFLDKKYWDQVMGLIGEDDVIDVFYTEKEEPVLVEGQTFKAVIYPMRIEVGRKIELSLCVKN